ncbi:hypothetical protein PGQ11_013700 [Apiospora arundinis]|uniref:2EXR domain-containing protein n=1 Tax=Apiospora arundinis TaxID=335852 RepID=A0ABR2HQC6_9PEZI
MADVSATETMDTFTGFPNLPYELRLIIWELVLDDEAPNRLVFVHRSTLRPMPIKCLLSPLLSANAETREVALHRYNLRLNVLRLPAMKSGGREHLTLRPARSWYDAYRTFARGSCSASDQTWLLQEGLEHVGIPTGALYLSLEKDRFMPFANWFAAYVHNYWNSCLRPFNGSPPAVPGPAAADHWKCTNNPTYNYVANALPRSICQSSNTKVVHFHEKCPLTGPSDEYWQGAFFERPTTARTSAGDNAIGEFRSVLNPSSQQLVIPHASLGPCQRYNMCNMLPSLIAQVSRIGAAHLNMEEWNVEQGSLGMYSWL